MSVLSRITDFMFPRQCHVCGVPLSPSDRFVCMPCLARLPRTLYHRHADNPMEMRFMGVFPFERATGHFFYSRGLDVACLVHDLKYHRFRGLARRMGELMAEELLPTGFLSDIDIIVPVPMHWLKKSVRGYNQTEEIAAGLSRTVNIPVVLALKAVKSHRTQTSMTLDQRLRNTQGVFRVSDPGVLAGRHVLLLDDVCTTGATLSEAARTITASVPAAKLSLLTLGVTF